MTKEEYILAVIDVLPGWEMGKTIKEGIQNNIYDEHTKNMLVIILNRAMDKITNAIRDSKMLEEISKRQEREAIVKDVLKELFESTALSSFIERKILSKDKGPGLIKKYQVFISSTFSDLIREREMVLNTIMASGCIAAGMELFPAKDEEQLSYIKRIIDESDYYVLIIGGRYGSLSEDGISYTEKEYNYAKEKGMPILAFLHKNLDILPMSKSELDPTKREKLISFREKVKSGRLVQFWESAEELSLKVSTSLSQELLHSTAPGWTRG